MVAITRIAAISGFALAASTSPAMIPPHNLPSAQDPSTADSNITTAPSGRTVHPSDPSQYHNPADCGKGQNPAQTQQCLEAATGGSTGYNNTSAAVPHNGADLPSLQPRISRGEFFRCGTQTCVTPAVCCGVDFGCRSFRDGCPGGSTRTGPASMMGHEGEEEGPGQTSEQKSGMVCDKEGYCSSS